MLPSVSVTPPMDIETNLTENYASQPMHLQENYLKPGMEDQLPFGASSSQGFLQDFHHIDNQFHVNGSSSNPIFGVQTPNFDPFDHNVTCESAPPDFEVYECKPFVSGNAHLMDNVQYVGYSMNLPQLNQLDMMVSSQSYMPFNPLETKPLNFVVPDEVSCISPPNYYKRVGLNKNVRESPSTRRTFKARKKSNTVKGQWAADEDRCIILWNTYFPLNLLFLMAIYIILLHQFYFFTYWNFAYLGEKSHLSAWTASINRLLIQLVEQYGVRKWSHISQALPGRIRKQCREQWPRH
ncbi:Transcription factor MYB98 [Spatholobus suberectus]|nr:Transcription factor MYB98 [Spatholobus suberectus]